MHIGRLLEALNEHTTLKGLLLSVDAGAAIAVGIVGFWFMFADVGRTLPAELYLGVAAASAAAVGAAVAAAAIVTAFLDQELLRKLEAIDESPVRPVVPFIWTALLGTAAIPMALASFVAADTLHWALRILQVGSLSVSVWAVTSLLPALDVLVQFLGVQVAAAGADDPGRD